jgi:hypothetical protein
VILDASFLISIDRGDHSARVLLAALSRSRTSLHTTHPVVAQVWRDGARQARLASFLNAVTIRLLDDGRALGRLLALTRTRDVVDAHLVLVAVRLRDTILTGDADELTHIADTFGAARPTIRPWP